MKSKDITKSTLELDEDRFGDFRSEQEEHASTFFLGEFEADLRRLIQGAYAEANNIGGQFRGPGLQKRIKNIINSVAAQSEQRNA